MVKSLITSIFYKFITINISRINRIRRKPISEILIFFKKRSRVIIIHMRDRIRMFFHDIRLSDEAFFDKLTLNDAILTEVKKAIGRKDLSRAKRAIINHMKVRNDPRFYFNEKEKDYYLDLIRKYFPLSYDKTLKLADDIINHNFYFLGKDVHLNRDIDWHSNFDNRRWPLTFSPNIDFFSNNKIGDIKLTWELNRHQHFVILGKAYWYSKDEKYAIEYVNQLLSWIDQNPYKRGINWMEGIETSIRLFSWIWSYYFFLGSDIFNEKAHFEFLKYVYMSTKFIEDHVSDKWSTNNNHLIAEAAGLTLIGILFPEFEDANKWKKRGINILEKELYKQILPDGVDWEQSTGYHKFITDLYLHIITLIMNNKIIFSNIALSKINKMVEFLYYITKTDGKIPLVGDEDEAKVIKLENIDYDDAKTTIRIGSILFKNIISIPTISEEAFWLLGKRSFIKKKKYNELEYTRIFKDSGYVIMRVKDKYLLFMTGPLNLKYLNAPHKHMDMLSIIVDAYGTYFLIDPGTYIYFNDFESRKYFKSIKSHNTIVVDDQDPSDIKEVFELSHIPFTKIYSFGNNLILDWIEAGYNGYVPICSVKRVIIFVKPEYWVIIDMLKSSDEHVYDIYFHFNYGLEIKLNETDKSVIAMGTKGNLKISPMVTKDLKGEILEGEISPRYGIKVKGSILRYRNIGDANHIFITLLYPYKNDINRIIIMSQINICDKNKEIYDENEVTGIKVDFGEYNDYLIYSHIGKTFISYDDVRDEKQIVYFRRKKE